MSILLLFFAFFSFAYCGSFNLTSINDATERLSQSCSLVNGMDAVLYPAEPLIFRGEADFLDYVPVQFDTSSYAGTTLTNVTVTFYCTPTGNQPHCIPAQPLGTILTVAIYAASNPSVIWSETNITDYTGGGCNIPYEPRPSSTILALSTFGTTKVVFTDPALTSAFQTQMNASQKTTIFLSYKKIDSYQGQSVGSHNNPKVSLQPKAIFTTLSK